jgi:hypothetical protein
MRVIQRVAMLVGGAISMVASGASAAPLAPTGPWVVDYSNDQCLLDRNYGSDARPLILAIRKVPMDSDVSVGVYTRDGNLDPRIGDAMLNLGASPIDAKFRAYSVPGKGLRNFTAYVPEGASLFEAAGQAATIGVRAPGEVDATFAVPELGHGLRALDACVADLAQSWGVPAEQLKRLKEPARALRQNYLQPSDYSPRELNENANARAQVRLWVDEAGKPLDCTPLKSGAGSTLFGDTTCRLLLKRAAFKPAIDVDGKPVRSIVVYTVDWVVG